MGLILSAERATTIETWSPPEVMEQCNLEPSPRGYDEEAQRNWDSGKFYSMVQPYLRFSIKGVIWYQGKGINAI